ncbi:acyl-CoA N-acyltransferase [Polyplosphaeria fusca]|uniref:Acyl-CoA N-acyltransferase n=1 Tax=Polyplosphaeria fusca TaxID=682080 RepID=A0A9P4QZD7_9PLEO|nr:acyl-CoA N-acyltransferase [Polyplosphaeria fusca]
MAYQISEANLSDAHAIASLFSISWTSSFANLLYGEFNPQDLANTLAAKITEQMVEPTTKFIVARSETERVVSVAQWTVPVDNESVNRETREEKEERERFEDELYWKKLPDSSNKDLLMDFNGGLRRLKEETLQGKKFFYLGNLATHREHRGKGLASKLIEWTFPQADEKAHLVYLETASDNPARRLYEKLGFRETGRSTIDDLSRYGGEGSHTHVALIRYPNISADTGH